MKNNQRIWQNWVAVLHTWGIHEIVATLLEAMGPLNFIGAQIVYLGQPILSIFLPKEQVNALAGLLDNPGDAEIFIESLRRKNLATEKQKLHDR